MRRIICSGRNTAAAWLGAVAACLCVVGSGSVMAEPVFPRGAVVGLEPPAGVDLRTGPRPGEAPSQDATILISESSRDRREAMLAGFTPEGFADRGFVADAAPDGFPVAGVEGRAMRGHEEHGGRRFRSWLVYVPANLRTAIVSVRVPVQQRDRFPDGAIETALGSIALRGAPNIEDGLAALSLIARDEAGFRPVDLLFEGAVFTEGPKSFPQEREQPVISFTLNEDVVLPEAKRAEFAASYFAELIREAEVASRSQDGDVLRMSGRGIDWTTGVAIHVVQLLRFTPRGCITIVAKVAEADATRYAERVDRFARSVGFR